MPVGALPVTMVQPPFFTSLMPLIGAAPLIHAGLVPAHGAAIAVPAITMRADVEDRMTMQPAARPLQEVCVAMGHRRHRSRRVDNSSWLCQVRTSSVVGVLT